MVIGVEEETMYLGGGGSTHYVFGMEERASLIHYVEQEFDLTSPLPQQWPL